MIRQVERTPGHPQQAVLTSNGGRGRWDRPDLGRIQRLLRILNGKTHYLLSAHRLHATTAPRFTSARLPVRQRPRRPPVCAQRRRRARL